MQTSVNSIYSQRGKNDTNLFTY